VVKTQNGAAISIKDIATVTQGAKIRLGQIGRAWHTTDSSGTSRIVDNPDTVEGLSCCKRATIPTRYSKAFTLKWIS